MSGFLSLVRKQLVEARWLLILTALALFGLCWLFVYATNRIETRIRSSPNPMAQAGRGGITRALGGPSADGSSTSFEIAWWRHPFIILLVLLWPITRGSAAVAGELDKGTLDLILSRPVSRASFLSAQVGGFLIGMLILIGAMVAGNQVGNHYNYIEKPPGISPPLWASLSVVAIMFVVYGGTLLFSTIDIVRWRPILIASTLILTMFILQILANIPYLENWKWLEHYSIFTAYDPVDAALKAVHLRFNAGLLIGIGLAETALGYLAFNYRDLPSNS